jgi:precorrin-4 methylase
LLALDAGLALAQGQVRRFEIAIAERRVAPAQRVVRVAEGERVELRWSADEPLVLHLHGYDIETQVAPGAPAVTAFTARLTGRFPVEIHGERGAKQRHRALLHVEIHPR